MEQVPAGWYADPHDANQQRWWDGTAWSVTTRVTPAPQPVHAATAPPPPAAAEPTAQPAGQTWPPSGGSASWSATPPTHQATDPLAIVALVAGLLWVVGVGSIVAIVCAIVVLRRGAQGTSRTLAFIGLALGVLGLLPALLVLAVLGAVSLPVIAGQQSAALEAQLHSDLRNAAIAQEMVFTNSRSYTTDLGELEAASQGGFASELTVVRAGDLGYCIEASNESGTVHIGSNRTTPTEGPCN